MERDEETLSPFFSITPLLHYSITFGGGCEEIAFDVKAVGKPVVSR